jgi:hypothetical protein
MADEPTPEQHRALPSDCWAIARALPTSGVLDRGKRPYRPIRFERKLESVSNDPRACSSTSVVWPDAPLTASSRSLSTTALISPWKC